MISKHNIWLLFLFLAKLSFAQPYGNEWIENEGYNKSYFKIAVTSDGIHRVSQATLAAAGLTGVSGDDLILYHHGQPHPIFVSTNGLLGASDFIEFYGEKNRGEVDKQLYPDSTFQPNPHYSLFNDTAVYFLTVNSAPVNPATKPRIQTTPNNLTGVSPEAWAWFTSRRVFSGNYSLGKPEIVFGTNFYNSIFDWGEGFVSGDFGNCNCPATRSGNLSSPSAFAGGPTATINMVAIAKSVNNHRLQIRINGNLEVDSSFSGFQMMPFSFSISPAQISNTTDIQLTGIAAGVDRNNLAYTEIIYPRSFDLGNASTYKCVLPAGSGRRKIELSNFDDRGQGFVVYDLDNNLRIEVPNPGAVPFQVELPPTSGDRELFFRSRASQDVNTVNSIKQINFTNFRNLGDYLIISHPKLYVDADNNGINEVEEYRRYRDQLSSSTGAFDARIIDINQLYDQFAYGVPKHHAAIPNFIRWALNEWSPAVTPQYVLLIGKGREYDDMRQSSSAYRGSTIPPYGYPGSDNLYTAVSGTGVPQVAIGRISVDFAGELDRYLRKVEQYEAAQAEFGDPYQSISNKAWMKEIMHFGGGTGSGEQTRFRNYLNNYMRTIEDTLFGGNVTSFFKTSTSPIQQVQSQSLKSRIDSGISMLTFFGHSAPGTFDISFDEPENYTNFGKYPLIFSNGCFAGYIYNSGKGISERFVLAENKGAIGFLSTTGLSLDVSLNRFATRFYENMAYRSYGQTVGKLINGTINDLYATSPTISDEMTAHEMTLNGDPALILNQYTLPDYAIEASSIYFDPPILNASRDSFDINIVIHNLGMAIEDSIAVDVSRIILNSGGGNNDLEYRKFVPAPKFKDTISFTLPTLIGIQGYGLNTFNISVESERLITELSETNNDLINQVTKSIVSDDIFPVIPYEFSIVPEQPITLKASTANPFAPAQNYRFEIDTTELFNSSLLQSTIINQTGGLVNWTPPMIWMDSTVYYWRVSKDSAISGNYNWNGSSFIYIDGEFPGWNQSHYYQFLKDDYANVFLDNDREFKFVPDQKELEVTTGKANAVGGNLPYQQLAYSINGVNQHLFRMGGCGGSYGLTFAIINPNTGLPDASVNLNGDDWGDDFGNYHCSDKFYLQYGYTFRTTGTTPGNHPIGGRWSAVIERFIDSIPNGHYVLVYSLNEPSYQNWDTALSSALLSLGAVDILQFTSGLSNEAPYIFFGQKGNGTFPVVETLGTNFSTPITETINFSGAWDEGFMRSDLIGPASEWGSFHWDYFSMEPGASDDVQRVNIYGVRPGGTETLLQTILGRDTTLQWIDANQYPFIRLEAFLRDRVDRTPPQMDYWRVLFNPVPEAALNPNRLLSFVADTLFQGEELQLNIAVENLTPLPMHPMLMKYSVVDASNRQDTFYTREDSLPGNDYITADFNFRLDDPRFLGQNILVIEANPDEDQPELAHFNNIGSIPFFVAGDDINPLLDVTFDGVRIFDGDIVSAEPSVLINLRDENSFLRLTDTNIFDVSILFPNGSYQELEDVDPNFVFYPAGSQGENVARLEFSPIFPEDGVYELIIRDRDMSGNSSTFGEYRISFEVVNESTVSNVLNYPNPFTSYTRFVFTLTGSRVPDFFKIQIMSASGTVVRELTEADLGPIHIGRNVTQYGWDGTDQYGAPLANGVYFYRVATSIDGEQIERRENSAIDQYFEKGFGKMVLIR